ncbi:histone acetyltransferase [Halobiforma lacisalsi AJ5]|uniref:Histone acetyltransferase n=1 Tax=Natronobacterium lacisalsi AJ5 TaxID=358396 RepID=M0LJW1_NATLA|nr:hypothetical protein [Halobiforma lacisalsi]APW97308.1 histone acetyltransferase [Halobiforma lacisalsi AJ5]EMA33821.1 histone acetyltransferase HPA2-like acetyltransferase [Halobiforma lacisalsi AJ5]
MTRCLPRAEVRPTQLYLSSEKLAGVLEWFDFDEPEYEPLPAFEHRGAWYLADGHTRAFAASLAGVDTIRIERDPAVRETYDFEVYRRCIEWCAEAGVETVDDLHGRVVGPEAYRELWVDRCQRVGDGG